MIRENGIDLIEGIGCRYLTDELGDVWHNTDIPKMIEEGWEG